MEWITTDMIPIPISGTYSLREIKNYGLDAFMPIWIPKFLKFNAISTPMPKIERILYCIQWLSIFIDLKWFERFFFAQM